MKIALLVLAVVVIGFLWWSVSLAQDKREKERKPDLLPGTEWRYTQEYFDEGLGRYTIRIETKQRPNDRELKELAEYAKRTHDKADKHIVFFDETGKMGAYLKVTYPDGVFEKLENFER